MNRIVVLNMAYATGAPRNLSHSIFNIFRYLMPTTVHLNKICRFLNSLHADAIGLLEVDVGSYRSSKKSQAARIGKHINNCYYVSTKYGDRITGKIIPILKHQGNAILTKAPNSNGVYHYMPSGYKKLVIELVHEKYRFFLLHLSISKRVRKIQLAHIANLLAANEQKPVIIAGDFNTFGGEQEVELIKEQLGLINPNFENKPTFPSWKPKYQLDFVLCSKQIKIKNFEIPNVKLSDHLPIILDFEI